jgi:S-adenosylmethionine hydrolase
MIALLTDFGFSEYVGLMKAVIYSINPKAIIVDLCHDVSPQSVIEASWILKNSYKYFPVDTTFCCVVDPGVGTDRKALAVKMDKYYFVTPDNGLLWETLKGQNKVAIRQIPIPQDTSKTFHGRDVFAKASAKIDLSRFDELGPETFQIEKLELYQNGREGMIVRIDRFGNVVTNLPSIGKSAYSVLVRNREYRMNYYSIYNAAEEDELFLVEGSNKTLEISLKNCSANCRLLLHSGERITIS